jgi:hypothetical protein
MNQNISSTNKTITLNSDGKAFIWSMLLNAALKWEWKPKSEMQILKGEFNTAIHKEQIYQHAETSTIAPNARFARSTKELRPWRIELTGCEGTV